MDPNTFDKVLLLIKKYYNSSNVDELLINNWDDLFQELNNQAISAIPTDVLADIAPHKVQKRLIQNATNSIKKMYQHLYAQDQLVQLFQKENVHFVIVKGLAIARYYPTPEYRSLGDVDICVLHEEYKKARNILLSNGFIEVESHYIKHSVYKKNGVEFELHKYFTSTNDIEKANKIEALIQHGIREKNICKLKGYSFPVLPTIAEGIMLLEHMSQHLESGIGLRHMIDWMMYVSHKLNDDVWFACFKREAEAAGLCVLAEIATKVCKKNFGLTGITWCDEANDELCERLLIHIRLRGNFGRKQLTTSEKSQKLFRINRNCLSWIRYLQKTGLMIPFVKENFLLHPFAWIIRSFNIIIEYKKRGNSLKRLRKDLEKATEIDAFLAGLGIRRVSKGNTYWSGKHFIIR